MKLKMVIEKVKPYVLCVFANLCLSGLNIVSKLSLNGGMSIYVLVAYGNAFGTLTTSLLALIFERNSEAKLSKSILRNIFLLGIFGTVLGGTLYYAGLQYTTPAFAAALSNLIPSMTFVLATLFRMEKFEVSKQSTQAKTAGTIVAFAGATLMTLYKGIVVISMTSRQHLNSQNGDSSKSNLDRDWIKGSLLLIVSCPSEAAFYILQSPTMKMYPAPLTLTSLTCLVGTILSVVMTLILDYKPSTWRLSWNINLIAPVYTGVMVFGITTYVHLLVAQTKGPVFLTAFRPLSTMIVAIIGLLVLGDALYLGSVIGGALIIFGLYATLWGKEKEKNREGVQLSTTDHQATEIITEK